MSEDRLERLAHRIADDRLQWKHNVLRQLVDDLKGFDRLLRNVKRRLAYAKTVVSKTNSL